MIRKAYSIRSCMIRHRRRWITALPVAALLVAALSLAGADTAAAQAGQRIFRSVPAPGDTTHVAVPGGRFEKGGFGRWFYGSDYRQLWTTPLELPVLDLNAVGGGLSPMRPGGAGQSISLHFMGEDGRRYTVRSIDKDPSKRLLDELKDTVVEDVIQDLVSAHLPAAGLVVDALMEATGVLHAPHRLVVIPDDPRLESFREEYAGLIGTLQEHPSEAPGNEPGFAGSRRVSGTERLYEGLEESPCERVDARAYLKARMIDFLIGDSDRHRGQWRWGPVSGRRLLHVAAGPRRPRQGLHRPGRSVHETGAPDRAPSSSVFRRNIRTTRGCPARAGNWIGGCWPNWNGTRGRPWSPRYSPICRTR